MKQPLEDYLLVTDLDGTLYKNQNFIPKINLEAINKFENLGGKFTICTGRGVNTAEFISQEIEFNCPLIVNGGHTFYDYYKDKAVLNVNLPESAKDFVALLKNEFPNAGIEIYSDRKIFCLNVNDVTREHLSYEKVDFIESTLEEVCELDWQKVLFEDEEEEINKIREFARENCPDDIRLMDTNRKFMEFATTFTDKGTAVLTLADMLDIPHSNVCAIGNYYNDLEMIEAAGIGAVVNDSPADLKAKADYITAKDCADGALSEFIDYIINL
ncbi:MAG: HAD-IIB family hydrolase [Acutalibacteraceae bacterium]|nr:HAD-IIB family hydrolase [Acutalibacteraceae bacterium]